MATSLTIDDDGSILVGGTNGTEGVLTRYAPDGTRTWTRELGPAMQPVRAVSVRNGEIFAAGGNYTGQLAVLSSEGFPQWSKWLPVAVSEMVFDDQGNLVLAGLPNGFETRVVEIDAEPFTPEERADGFEVPRWSHRWSEEEFLEVRVHGLAVDSRGRVFVGAQYVDYSPSIGSVVQLGG